MGKYGNLERLEVENQEVFEARMLQGIANELAEANRLKRLELRKIESKKSGDKVDFQYIGELNDQA